MRIKIFRAPTLSRAMNEIRNELGLDALILATETRSGLVEVTAALELDEEPAQQPVPIVASPAADEPSWRWHGVPQSLAERLLQQPLEVGCARLLRFRSLLLGPDSAPLMLAGPPGAGKTVTIAKLAARLVLDGHKPMVITADERRAGAVEQLAAFTRLLGLTLVAAGRPETIERALERRESGAPVLIDAPGLDLDHTQDEDLLSSLCRAANASLALVLPTGLDACEAEDIGLAHAALGAEHLIATRFERGRRLGGILAAAHGAGLALTEAGTSAHVADGLVSVTPALLASRLEEVRKTREQAAGRKRSPSPPNLQARATTSPRMQHERDQHDLAAERSALQMHIAAQARSNARQQGRIPL